MAYPQCLQCWTTPPMSGNQGKCPLAPDVIPDLLGGVKQYNMKTILESCRPVNGHGTQYLVKWFGYPLSENLWISTSSFATGLKKLIYEFHQAHPDANWAPTVANPPAQPPQWSTCTHVPWTCALFGLTIRDIWCSTPVLQAQVQPKEGILSRISLILTWFFPFSILYSHIVCQGGPLTWPGTASKSDGQPMTHDNACTARCHTVTYQRLYT